MTNVAWFDTEGWEKDYLQKINHDLSIDFYEEPLNKDNVEEAEGYDAVAVFIDSKINQDVIDDLDVDLIACRSTGYDHVDTDYAAKNELMVSNVPSYGASTIAEHAFGLLLNLTRKISEAERKVRDGSFSHKGLSGTDLEGKKLGVIGTGGIGERVIEIARGFNMDVIAYDPYPRKNLEHEIGFMYTNMEDLVEQADIISLHCPLTEENYHMLSEEQFEKMDNTIILNTARGELIDTEALIEALKNGNVSSAGLDVLEDEAWMKEDVEKLSDSDSKEDIEKALEDHILVDRQDVIVTPHNAFNSQEALQRIAKTTVRNIERRENVVNTPWG